MSTWSDLKNTARLKNIYDTRIAITKSVREFFWSQGFVETDTPIAVRLASQEPYLNPMSVVLHDPTGQPATMHLRTSPEYALKKMLAAGYEKIFEIGKCFRDFESFGGNHNPEFTMLEWYRSPGTYQEIMDDAEKLFQYVGRQLQQESVIYKNHQVSILGNWDRLSMRQVWQQFLNVELNDYLELGKLCELARSKGYAVEVADAYEDVFYKIFLNEIEPQLGLAKPVFVYDYPAHLTSLSRLCDHDRRYAERFELYVAGLEIANAFGELTDAKEQQEKLEADKRKRGELGKEMWPVDPEFIGALESGIASAGGIALGIDRMVLLFTGAKDLNETIFQSAKDQLEAQDQFE